jgi:hypothetical protein
MIQDGEIVISDGRLPYNTGYNNKTKRRVDVEDSVFKKAGFIFSYDEANGAFWFEVK